MLVCGVGGALMSNDAPSGVELLIVVRTSFARRTAPSTFSSPAPCSNVLELGSCCAVYINSDFTMFGVSVGLASNIKAAVPATRGAAIEVPLSVICLRVGLLLTLASSEGFWATRKLFGDWANTVLFPGAESSGLIRLS